MTNPIAQREASYLESAARDHAAMGDQVSADNCRKVAAEILASGDMRQNHSLRKAILLLRLVELQIDPDDAWKVRSAIDLILKEIRE